MGHIVYRVAEAMVGLPLQTLNDEDRAAWLANARAAIVAMREPTADMIAASRYYLGDSLDVAVQYRAMIDAALKEVEAAEE